MVLKDEKFFPRLKNFFVRQASDVFFGRGKISFRRVGKGRSFFGKGLDFADKKGYTVIEQF